MGRKLGLSALVGVAFVIPSNASAASLTCARAKSAVEKTLGQRYAMFHIDFLECHRLTRTRARVDFGGKTGADLSSGNIDGHSGSATVRRYEFGTDVSITSYHFGGAK